MLTIRGGVLVAQQAHSIVNILSSDLAVAAGKVPSVSLVVAHLHLSWCVDSTARQNYMMPERLWQLKIWPLALVLCHKQPICINQAKQYLMTPYA